MAGGTLVMSRAVNNHAHYKKRFEALGFRDVTLTALEKDALNSLIGELKPSLIIMGARYYQNSTPYMMGELHKKFPKVNMAAVCIGEYPDELGMSFIVNGIKSYVCSFEGIDQFYQGLGEIAKGRQYISPAVQKRISMRAYYPSPAATITDRQKEVIRLTCSGFKETEIADLLHISRRTVDTHKQDSFISLNVRSSLDLVKTALNLGITSLDELFFEPGDFVVKPVPNKNKSKGVGNDYSD